MADIIARSSIFDGLPKPATAGIVVPGNNPWRKNELYHRRTWYIDALYDPDIHSEEDLIIGKYIVPYELELIRDTKNKVTYIVTHVDTGNWKSTLVLYSENNTGGNPNTDPEYPLFPVTEAGLLNGELPLMIDYSTVPPVARASVMATNVNPAYAILYLGSIIDPDVGGKIISAIYSGNELTDNRIPVIPITPEGWNVENEVIKCTSSFSVLLPKETLKNGTRCTLVYYDQNGYPLPDTYTLRVQHSQYLRDHNLAQRYVKSIELLSPWFTNSSTPSTLYIPINLPLKQVVFYGKINYSDGTSEVQPVNSYDGISGFTIHGVDKYKPTVPNQKGRLVLTYQYKPNEYAYIAQPGQPSHTSIEYFMVSTKPDGAYGPRLYSYPYWNPSSGWLLKHYLTDLTRRFTTDVTEYVKLNQTSPAFQGRAYGVEQDLAFNLTLGDVSPAYENWTFVQHVGITLYNDGTSANRKWETRHSYTSPWFENLEILYVPDTKGGQKAKFNTKYNPEHILPDHVQRSLDEFLKQAYYGFDPMYDTLLEEKPIRPTHMRLIRQNNTSITFPIESYKDLVFSDMTLINAETFYISWVERDSKGEEKELGVSAAITRKVSSL